MIVVLILGIGLNKNKKARKCQINDESKIEF